LGKKVGEAYGDNLKSEHRDNQNGERYPVSFVYFSNSNKNKLHPTQKPVALCEYLIKTYSNEGDTVLDNCMGSGTTCLAAKNLNRGFIGIEKEEKYYNIAKKRLEYAK
jgi:site-specific DNA-methyltransferase (adenine-specific)